MRTRALVGLACAWAMVVWLPAQGAERPTSEAIRAAAAAVGPAVVRVEVARGQRGGQQIPDFRIWPPGEVVPQPRARVTRLVADDEFQLKMAAMIRGAE